MAGYSLTPVNSAGFCGVLLDGRQIGLLCRERPKGNEWGIYPSGQLYRTHAELPAPFEHFVNIFPSLDEAKDFLGIAPTPNKPGTASPLDLAYAEINALGGWIDPNDCEAVARDELLGQVLAILQRFGAVDPDLAPALREAA